MSGDSHYINKSVLLVDDSQVMRQIIFNSLRQLGFIEKNVSQATDGQQALNFLDTREFNLILSDWVMPGMNGLELLKLVKANPSTKNIPFLMITSESDKKHLEEAENAGVDQYIVKPFNLNMLEKAVHHLLMAPNTFGARKVLVVDDSDVARKIIVKNLLHAGFMENCISQASDGLEAVDLIRGNSFDLVVTDWHMPKMDGLELTRNIRKDGNPKNVPVLMVTAENDRDKVLDAIKSGVSNYIVKPFNAMELQEKICALFGHV